MKNKKKIIAAVLAAIVFCAIFLMQEMRIADIKLESKRIYAKQSFGTMMYIKDQMEQVAIDYESEMLTSQELKCHYEHLDSYILSVYNQKPDKFISNLNTLRLMDEFDIDTFNQNVYYQYIKIVSFFNFTYQNIEENHTKDAWLDYYNVFSSDEFNNHLELLIEDLYSNK